MPRDSKTTKESSSNFDDKIKALNAKFGIGFITSGPVDSKKLDTSILTLDYLMQYKYKKRSCIMFHGAPESLKTSIGLKLLANAQKRQEKCLVVNVEKGFDDERATKMGVDIRKDVLHRVEELASAETYLQFICDAVNLFDFILVDSIATMSPQEELTKDLTDTTTRAPLASLLSKALRKINSTNKSTTILYINQERINPNATGASKYIPGGEAQKFLMDYRFEFKIVEYYDKDKNTVGQTINQVDHKPIIWALLKVTNKKNRRGERQIAANIMFNMKTGEIDLVYETIMLAKRLGVIELSGSWMTVPGIEKQMQDKTLTEYLEKDETALNNLRALIIKKLEEI